MRFTLNGEAIAVEAPPMMRLLDVVRDGLGRTGTKEGCGEGECGACTVLIDGVPAASCLVPVCQAEGTHVATIEGVAGDVLHVVQQALLDHGGAQCGICTPGFVMTAVAVHGAARAAGRAPTRDELREVLAGNLCRCTGYEAIVRAIEGALLQAEGSREKKTLRMKAKPKKKAPPPKAKPKKKAPPPKAKKKKAVAKPKKKKARR